MPLTQSVLSEEVLDVFLPLFGQLQSVWKVTQRRGVMDTSTVMETVYRSCSCGLM